LAQLVTGTDLGDGWNPVQPSAQPSPASLCLGALDAASSANPHAQAAFTEDPWFYLSELVIQFPSPDEASASYQAIVNQFVGCGATPERISTGQSMSAAYSGTAGTPPGGWLWQVGVKGSMMGVLTLNQPGTPPVPGELQPLATAAFAKMSG